LDAPRGRRYDRGLGDNYEAHATLLLFVALNPFVEPLRMSDHAIQAFIESLRRIAYFRYFRGTERVSPEDKELLVATLVR
jgi:hypothetical protein